MNTRIFTATCGGAMLAVATLMCAPSALAGVPGEEWSVTTTAKMTAPMAMTMPTRTSTTCRPKGERMGPPPMKNSDCKVNHWDHTGDRMSFELTCSQASGNMHGKGWTEISGDTMKGHMSFDGNAAGMAMAMTVDYHGKRTGTCTAEKSD